MRKYFSLLFYSVFLLSVLIPSSLHAEEENVQSVTTTAPHFFIAILAGLVLAFGFQMLLTFLSIASGVSFIPSIEKSQAAEVNNSISALKNKPLPAPIPVLITSGFGVWAVITASLSLFFASFLALRLSITATPGAAVALGLVIWAGFFMLMIYMEVQTAGTVLGKGLNTAMAGFKTLVSTPAEKKVSHAIKDSIESIREEVAETMDNSKLSKKIDRYIDKLKPTEPDYEKIRKEFSKLIQELELEQTDKTKKLGFEKEHFYSLAEKHSHLSIKDIKKYATIFAEVYAASKLAGPVTHKLASLAGKQFSKMENEEGSIVKQLEDYLKRTGREELNPDNIKKDLEKIFNEPNTAINVLSARLSKIDRSTITALLAQRKDMTQEEAKKITDNVFGTLDFIKNKFSGDGNSNGNGKEATNEENTLLQKLESKLKAFFDSLDRPEFDYEGIKRDFQLIFHDPRTGLKALQDRLNMYDHDSLVALIASNEHFSKEEADKIVTKIEEARDSVLKKAEKIETEALKKLEEAKQFAIHEAEVTRKTAVAAAWWLFITATVSGVAAVIGGILG